MQLHDYQTKYLENAPKNFIMAADVGLGKTIMALEHGRRHGATKIIVIAPASKVRTGDWQREINRFYEGMERNDDIVISYEMFTKKWKDL